ncbi:MAG: HAMP domain-containing histidine kinase, partial [Burkholderiales bacterium]
MQLAIACMAVVLFVLVVQAMYGESLMSPLTAITVGIALSSVVSVLWLGYRATRRVVAPLDWVLGEVARWDPQRPDMDALAPHNVPESVQGDGRRLAEALHALGQRLDAHVARERDFTRDASHELRTPLTVIRVAADLIDHDEGLSVRSRRSLARIKLASESMESLMSALLLLARDQSVPLETEDFSVREVLEHQLEKAALLFEDKDVVL